MKNKLVLLLFLFSQVLLAQENSNSEVLLSTNAFLKSLSEELKAEASFEWDGEQRKNWFYTPVPRKGLDYRKLSSEQRKLFMDILHASLSEQGAQAALAIMQLEGVLHVLENQPADSKRRDPEKYYFSIFGSPDPDNAWAWRIEGHHLSLNYSSSNGKISSATPLFFGTNPAVVPAGMPVAEGTEVLKAETAMGFSLLHSLSSDQMALAKINDKAPADMLTSNKQKAIIEQDEGLLFTEMDKKQQRALMDIISHHVKRAPSGFAKEMMKKIENAGLEKLHFVWMGGNKWGEGHYYRIHSSVILIEYDCTQNNNNHVHSVVRDLNNDWGEDVIGAHIRNDH